MERAYRSDVLYNWFLRALHYNYMGILHEGRTCKIPTGGFGFHEDQQFCRRI